MFYEYKGHVLIYRPVSSFVCNEFQILILGHFAGQMNQCAEAKRKFIPRRAIWTYIDRS